MPWGHSALHGPIFSLSSHSHPFTSFSNDRKHEASWFMMNAYLTMWSVLPNTWIGLYYWKTLYHEASLLVYGTGATVLKGHSESTSSRLIKCLLKLILVYTAPSLIKFSLMICRSQCRHMAWLNYWLGVCAYADPRHWSLDHFPLPHELWGGQDAVGGGAAGRRKPTPHASLICKHWHRIVSDILFVRRSRAHHRCRPPLSCFVSDPWGFSYTSTMEAPDHVPAGRGSWLLDPRHWSLDWFWWTTKRFPGIAEEIHPMDRFQQNRWSFTLWCDNAPWITR